MPNSNKKKRPWEEEKERLLNLTQEQRRQELSRDYISLHDIPTWLKQYGDTPVDEDNKKINSLCGKVSLYKGDITQLEVDAIVNAGFSQMSKAATNELLCTGRWKWASRYIFS